MTRGAKEAKKAKKAAGGPNSESSTVTQTGAEKQSAAEQPAQTAAQAGAEKQAEKPAAAQAAAPTANAVRYIKEQAQRRLLMLRARRHFRSFVEWTTPNWKPSRIHTEICTAFDMVLRGETDRLMLLCPPQHGKSLIASKRAPAYFLGLNPTWEIICVSATSTLSEEFGGDVRDCVASPEYRELFPEVQLSQDTAAKWRWKTTQGGGYVALGVGSQLMGRGAELAIIDDPFANWDEAQSPAEQERVWRWYRGTFYNRVRPNAGAIIVIQHRMHVNDLAGRLLAEQEKGGDKWHVVKLAADLDNPPWPERYNRAALERIRANTDSRQWSALYMQEPIAPGGGEFKRDWLNFYDGPPERLGGRMNRYILVDPSSGRRKDKTNDRTSMWVVGCASDNNYYILDFICDRLNLTERAAALLDLHRKWKPYQVRYEHVGMQADIEHIRHVQAQQNYRFAITEVAARIEKDTRIRRLVPLFEQRRVWLPRTLHRTLSDGRTVDLINEFIEQEYLAFPGSRFDDSLDALARIAEPDLPLVWPREDADDDAPGNVTPLERYRAKRQNRSAWAAM